MLDTHGPGSKLLQLVNLLHVVTTLPRFLDCVPEHYRRDAGGQGYGQQIRLAKGRPRMRLARILIVALLPPLIAICSPAASARKHLRSAPQAPAVNVGVDAKALELIKGMSDKLAAAQSLSFTARRAFDEPATNGQPLFYMVVSNVVLQRPDKLKVVVPGDGPPSEFLYDGKTMTVLLPDKKLAAVAEAPPALDDMFEAAIKKAGIYFPFVDFLASDPYKEITEGLESAFVIGQSNAVGDTTTNVVALSNKNVQAQIWIGAADQLPRLVWLTPTDLAGKARSMIEFSDWRLGSQTSPADFTSTAGAEFRKIEMAVPTGEPATP
jgi:hypothetical protein